MSTRKEGAVVSVIEMDETTNRITSVESRIFWNFDAFLANLLFLAAKEFREHEKVSWSAILAEHDGDPSLRAEELRLQKEFFKRLERACSSYLNDCSVGDTKKLKKYQEVVRELADWLPSMWT